jgi:methionine-rich copper-binding protein CopC
MKKYLTGRNYSYFFIVTVIIAAIVFSCEKDDNDDADIINPYVISYNPVSGVEGIATDARLYLTFDGVVNKGEGKITITTDVEQGKQIIDINDAAVTLANENRIVVIDPPVDFYSGRTYNVTLDPGIVIDLAGNKYFGMPDNETWTFKTGGAAGDLVPPEIAALVPADGATDAGIIKLKLTFNEPVKKGTGNIVVYNSSDQEVVAIDVTTDAVIAKESDMIVTYPAPLAFGASYYIKFDAGVVKDAGGNDFAGIADKTTWNFTTTTGSASDLIVHLPFEDNLSDISGNKFDAVLGTAATANVEFVQDATRGKVVHFIAGSYAQLPKHDLLRMSVTDNFSFNLWIKTGAIGSDPAILGNKDWGSGGNPGFVLSLDNADGYVPDVSGGAGWILNCADYPKGGGRVDWRANECTPADAPQIADNNWHMLTVVFDRTAQKLVIYCDGKEYAGNAANRYDLSTVPHEIHDTAKDYPICLWEDGTGGYNAKSDTRKNFTGYMDDLKVYNKALTPNEVKALFGN